MELEVGDHAEEHSQHHAAPVPGAPAAGARHIHRHALFGRAHGGEGACTREQLRERDEDHKEADQRQRVESDLDLPDLIAVGKLRPVAECLVEEADGVTHDVRREVRPRVRDRRCEDHMHGVLAVTS